MPLCLLVHHVQILVNIPTCNELACYMCDKGHPMAISASSSSNLQMQDILWLFQRVFQLTFKCRTSYGHFNGVLHLKFKYRTSFGYFHGVLHLKFKYRKSFSYFRVFFVYNSNTGHPIRDANHCTFNSNNYTFFGPNIVISHATFHQELSIFSPNPL